MQNEIEKIKKVRTSLLTLLQDYSLAQLNEIPVGFNNNIIWNLGHLVAAQQGLCYIRASLPTPVEESFMLSYRPGTKPEKEVNEEEVNQIKHLLFSTLDQLETDCNNQIFNQYTAFNTRYNVMIASVEEATAFILFHEGLHMGYIMALRKVIQK